MCCKRKCDSRALAWVRKLDTWCLYLRHTHQTPVWHDTIPRKQLKTYYYNHKATTKATGATGVWEQPSETLKQHKNAHNLQ